MHTLFIINFSTLRLKFWSNIYVIKLYIYIYIMYPTNAVKVVDAKKDDTKKEDP